MPTPSEIIDFWLHEVGSENWYSQSDEIDAKIEARFRVLRDEAASGAHADWLENADGALALMLLLDQFSRNLYRGDAESFRADPLARDYARKAIEKGFDQEFEPKLRQFFYMPFCHSEAIEDQNWLLEIAASAGVEDNLPDFHAHHDIIAKFGRFPFRNQALGRESTDDEKSFMQEGGYMKLRNEWIEKLAN